MTDQELIRLLHEKSAAALTSEEILIVRLRWADSAEFRLACRSLPDVIGRLNLCESLGAGQDIFESTIGTVNSSSLSRTGAVRYGILLSGVCVAAAIGLLIWLKVYAPAIVPLAESPTTQTADKDTPLSRSASDDADEAGRHAIDVAAPAGANEDTVPTLQSKPDVDAVSGASSSTPPIAPTGPWATALAENAPVWSPDSPQWTADYQRSGHDEFPESAAKLWLDSVESDPIGWSTELIGKPAHRVTRFQGLGKLRAPWRGDAVLRMTPFDVSDLTLLFWTGKSGLALRYFPHCEPPLWAAYQITREDASPRPKRWALVTTDSGAYARSTPGTFDIRHQNQSLVLARGGLVLMSGPLAVPPTEVYVSGQFRLRGLTMHRSDPLPMRDEMDRRQIVDEKTAILPWTSVPVEYGQSVSQDDGSMSLMTGRGAEDATTSVPINRLPGLEDAVLSAAFCEIRVRLLSAEAGTGFFLGDREGRPLYRWEFNRDTADDALVLRPYRMRQNADTTEFEFRHGPKATLAQPIWLKWLLGLDRIHLLISGDGQNWGAFVDDLARSLTDEVASFGLFGSPSEGSHTIRVSHVQGCELSGLMGAFPCELLGRVEIIPVEGSSDISVWKQRMLDQQPEGVDPAEWFIANAVRFLSQRPAHELGRAVFGQLLDVAINSKLSVTQKFDLLRDASMMCDASDDFAATSMARWYAELGRQLVEADDPVSSMRVRQAVLLRGPAWTKNPFQPVCDQLQSHEILRAVYGQDWNAAWTSARTASFWSTLPQPDAHTSERGMELNRHARWVESLAAEYAPRLDDGTTSVMSPNLRHPLVLTVDKAAYSARAEMQAALSSSTYDEACRIAIATTPDGDQVLLPDVRDSAWFVSFGVFQKMARHASPEFARVMSEHYLDLGAIRLRSAANQNDLAAVSAIARQFMGTDAARDASIWLGDRELASGQFDSAVQRYLDALESREGSGHDVVGSRLVLARTLAGQLSALQASAALGEMKQTSVALSSATLTKTEFETLIRDLRDRRERRYLVDCDECSDLLPLEVRPYELAFRARFDGDIGTDPGRWEFRSGDAIARQLAVTSDVRRFYVSNRFQITSYSKDGAETSWTCGLGDEQADTHLLPFIPMKPLVTERHLFVRRLTKSGAELACIELAKGEIVWHQRPSQGVLTDPVIWNGRLFAVTATKGEDDLVQVAATWFDDSTGAVSEKRALFALREPVERWYAGQIELNDRLAVCTVAGTTACFDWKGEMKWLRRHLMLRKPVDELADDFRVHAPILNEQQVVVALPGVREVCCFDLQNGRTVWNRPIADIRGILGASDSRIVIDTPRGLLGLSRETGASVWFVPVAGRHEMFWMSDSRCAVAHRTDTGALQSAQVVTWWNVETGERLGQSPIQGDLSEELLLGPLFSSGSKFFTFAGISSKNAKRELYELLPIDVDQSVPGHRGSAKPQ